MGNMYSVTVVVTDEETGFTSTYTIRAASSASVPMAAERAADICVNPGS